MATEFAKIFASNAFTRQQVETLRRLVVYIGTSSDFATDADIAGAITAHEAAPDPHPGYATDTALASAISSHEVAANPHPTYLTQAEADLIYDPLGSSSDLWTHVVLASDQTIAPGTTDTDITGMAFTPAANKKYAFEFRGTWEASSTSANHSPCMGISWPTGLTTGSVLATIGCGNASSVRGGGIGATIGAHSMAASATGTPFPVVMSGHFTTGATPSGTIQLRMRTGVAGAHTITMKAGSILSYRQVP